MYAVYYVRSTIKFTNFRTQRGVKEDLELWIMKNATTPF